jgi:hypothetical protein
MSPRAQLGITQLYRGPRFVFPLGSVEAVDHRQDSKGTRWMPWHQEPKKGVDDCDKQRLGVEQPLTR